MVIVDTNIWIEFFKGSEEYVEQVQLLMKNRLAVTLEPIFAELLYGVRDVKDKTTVLNYWHVLPRIDLKENYLLEAAIYANNNKLYAQGVGLMDAVIIKATKDNNCLLTTLDKKIIRFLDDKSIYNL